MTVASENVMSMTGMLIRGTRCFSCIATLRRSVGHDTLDKIVSMRGNEAIAESVLPEGIRGDQRLSGYTPSRDRQRDECREYREPHCSHSLARGEASQQSRARSVMSEDERVIDGSSTSCHFFQGNARGNENPADAPSLGNGGVNTKLPLTRRAHAHRVHKGPSGRNPIVGIRVDERTRISMRRMSPLERALWWRDQRRAAGARRRPGVADGRERHRCADGCESPQR